MRIAIFALVAIAAFGFIAGSHEEKKWWPKLNGEVTMTDDEILDMYHDWIKHHEKDTSDIQAVMERFTIFKEKTREVIAHNSDSTKSWKKGINAYSDQTDDEFYGTTFPLMDGQECSATNTMSWTMGSDQEELPESVDWRDAGVVANVKNQGSCGSCWTFSTVGAFESHYAIATGGKAQDHLFSEQQLVDCAGAFDNHGCSGGLPSHAFTYIYYHGIATEDGYPYFAQDHTCTYNADKLAEASDFGSFNITEGDEYSLHEVLAKLGPVSIAYQVVGDFRDYHSGVYSST